MKKIHPKALTLFEQEPPEEDIYQLAPVIPIRTETSLARLPLHRLSKRGDIVIKTTKKNERGQVASSWEVKHPAGPLAYKIDTLVINRYIDEMRMRGEIGRLFRLGSLREICELLGISPEGKNTKLVKDALYQNVEAIIKCKLNYKGNDGTERNFEFGASRYTVIFTGEKLPNEKRADAVYILLNDVYLSLLEHSKTRPLDYEYLKALAPAPQRLYELL